MTERGIDRHRRFRGIFEECVPKIANYARRRVRADEVDDVISETFLVVWRRLEDVPVGATTLPWVYGVARRVVSDRLRAARRRHRLGRRLEGLRQVREPTTEAALDAEVALALSELRPGDRELLMLTYWEELTPEEIGGVLGVSTNAVTIRLYRARRQFAAILERLRRAGSTSPGENP